MKRISLIASALLLLMMSALQAQADELRTTPYTSTWGDFKIAVPEGWNANIDAEGTHYTNTSFKGFEPDAILQIRWYTRYSTHRQVDGTLELYSGPEDFANQFSNWYGTGLVTEQAHEISIGDRKAQRFAGRLDRLQQSTDPDNRRARLGGLVGIDEAARNGGRQVWTVVPAPSGFYVFAYFVPDDSYERYNQYYEQMISSFAQIKDGPNGATMPGYAVSPPDPNLAEKAVSPPDPNLAEKIEHWKFEGLLSSLKSRRANLFSGPVTKDIPDLDYGGTRKKTVSSGWFVDTALLGDIVKYASTMKPAPAIPEGAKRNFVKANTFLKDAKNSSDYKYTIDAYEEALFEAPWWGNAYYNLGIALAGAGWYDDAKESINLYLLTNPSEADKDQAQNKIYEIEAQQELKEKREAAIKAKYGGGQGEGYNFDALYRYGAVVQNMSFDSSGNERTISLKIATRKENGYLHTYFQVFDLTSSNDVFGQKFSVDWRGTQTFWLDDRDPNRDLMTLTVTSYGDGDAKITIRPTNNASASIQTSLLFLLKELASQAVYAGGKTNIGGREFYVLGQGGAKGSLLYFPPEIKDQLESGTVRELTPAFVAIVNYRGSDGSNQRYDNPDLGEVNGTHYHLQWNGGYWEAKPGRGEDY